MNKNIFLKLTLQITKTQIVWDSIDTDAQWTSKDKFLIVCCRWKKCWNVLHASQGYFYHMTVCYFVAVNGKLAFDMWVLTRSIHRTEQPTQSLLLLTASERLPKLCFTRLHYSMCWWPVFTTAGKKFSLLCRVFIALKLSCSMPTWNFLWQYTSLLDDGY